MQSPYAASMTTQPNAAGYGSANDLSGYGGKAGYAGREKKELPHRTGELRAAPPDAGALQIALPNPSTKVWMDGEPVSSSGLTRYFVTPNLDQGKEATYDIKIEWTQNGESRTQERKVTVAAGKIAVVDFTKKDNSSSVTRKSSY
ncbi:MAG: TIGR03000 domain-containing protein [Gemmataceae bacterium]